MSLHAIHLRSDSPPLLVEFNLPPGTHARIGLSPSAEISLPLAGLADIAGVIGRTPEGRIYYADAAGVNVRHIELPAALALPPYQFVVFHPVGSAEASPTKTALLQPTKKKLLRQSVFALGALGFAVAVTAALIATNHGGKPPGAISALPSAPAAAPTINNSPALAPQKVETIIPFVNAAPPPAPPVKDSIAPSAKNNPSPPAKFDLEALAQRVAPTVFRLEVKDAAGTVTGTGTAFAISADGLAVTNYHVVDGGESFTARTTHGAEFAVSGITATDPAADLALVTLKAINLPFLELGESDSLNIGAPIAVFGAPRGLSGTMSDGILSARRTESEIEGAAMPNGGRVLQITAPISAGSSGSPVIDSTGKVIGVAAAGLVAPNAQNLNFVIPVEAVKKLQKDAASGIADLRQAVREVTRPRSVEVRNPDSAFFEDPDFQELRSVATASNWIKCTKLARQMTERHPKSPRAQAFLGIALNGLGLHEQAESAFASGLANNPEDVNIWGLLGNAQERQNKVPEARASWKRGGAISPDYAPIWSSLANSFMRTREYFNAVTPLENLRKADREKFNELMEFYRMLRGRPPELQALFDHFDNMRDDSNKAAVAPADPEQLAGFLVAAFLRHGESPDIQAELADYAASVNPYFDQGIQQKPAILKDITTYRAQWPRRSLRLVEIETARQDDINTLEASFRLRYSATNGKTTRSGTLRQGIRYVLTEGRWLVSGIQTIERVPESRVPSKER